MKIEDLKNTKIYLSNEEDRIKFQKKVFKLGVEWWNGGLLQKPIKERPFYYIDNNLKLSFGYSHQKIWFRQYEYKQIFLEDVLAIKEPKEECEFKPFDRVLVRDSDNERWRPRFFAWHNVDYKENYPYPFETTDGCFHSYCIPYDENLANTTKSKEE